MSERRRWRERELVGRGGGSKTLVSRQVLSPDLHYRER